MRKRKRTGSAKPSAASLANLRPWKPGQSGNPAGRPKSITLSESYRKLLEQPYPGDKQGRTWAEVIALNISRRAAKGQISAAQEIADRIEGRPAQALSFRHSGNVAGGGPPAIIVNFVSSNNGEITPTECELRPSALERMLQIEATHEHRENTGENE